MLKFVYFTVVHFAKLVYKAIHMDNITCFYWVLSQDSILQFSLCLASVSRSLVEVAGGATRAAITQHQAKANNISDVAAKDGSQVSIITWYLHFESCFIKTIFGCSCLLCLLFNIIIMVSRIFYCLYFNSILRIAFHVLIDCFRRPW